MKRVMMLLMMAGLIIPVTVQAAEEAKDAKVAPATTQPVKKAAFPTEKENISYALGIQIGNMLKQTGEEIDLKVFTQALEDVLKGKPLAMQQDELMQVLTDFQNKMRAKATKEIEDLGAKNKAEEDKFLKENAKKEGVKTTASGLQYKVIKEGTGKTPKATDTVKVNYAGKFLDGKEFDSSYKRGEPAEFKADQVIKGWTEALTMMKEGSKYELYIPAKLAYGEEGRGPIPPNSMLIFEVELLNVVQPKAATEAAPATK
jgi:FKBP-type peptidyl-prolyl cis-trans isomerase FklB